MALVRTQSLRKGHSGQMWIGQPPFEEEQGTTTNRKGGPAAAIEMQQALMLRQACHVLAMRFEHWFGEVGIHPRGGLRQQQGIRCRFVVDM